MIKADFHMNDKKIITFVLRAEEDVEDVMATEEEAAASTVSDVVIRAEAA